MAKKNEKNTVRYVYAGRRVRPLRNEVLQLFINEKGEEALFKGIKGVFLGNEYAGGESTLPVRPDRVAEGETKITVTQDQLDEWNASDDAALEQQREWRESARAKREAEKASKSKRVMALRSEVLAITKNMDYMTKMAFVKSLLREKK